MIEPIYQCFTQLPNLTKIPNTPTSSTLNLALIPLFQDAHVPPQNIPALLQSAIYARATCLLNTDALDCNIPVKLYIEQHLRHQLTPQLKANAINPDTDVLWFTPPEQNYAYLGKKSHLYYDENLAHHHWIVAWDADTYFLPKNPRTQLFHTLLKLPKQIHYIRTAPLSPDYKNKIKRFVGENVDIDALIQHITGKAPKEFTDSLPTLHRPVGYFFAIPPNQLHTKHPAIIHTIRTYSPILGCDEITTALAAHNANYTLQTFPHIHATSMYQYLTGMDAQNVDIVHGRTPHQQTHAFVHLLETAANKQASSTKRY